MKTLFELDLTRRLTVAFAVAVTTFSLINGFVTVSEHNIQRELQQYAMNESPVQRA
jgi:hypothetical protein